MAAQKAAMQADVEARRRRGESMPELKAMWAMMSNQRALAKEIQAKRAGGKGFAAHAAALAKNMEGACLGGMREG